MYGIPWWQSIFENRLNHLATKRGHVFQGYKALLIEDDGYLLQIVKRTDP